MSSKPLVSIIIPCKDLDNYTKESIAFCKRLDYPNFEIILLPDYTAEAIDGVKVLATGPVAPGVKRNVGVKSSGGEFCAFIDNDAYPRNDWLTSALKYFEDHEVGGVGGPGLTPEADGFMQKAGGYVLSSFMVGNLSSRYKTKSCFESDDIHSCNFIAPKTVIEAAGGWNEKYWPGEDTLMCLAIEKLGKKLIESSDVVVYHHRRSLFKPHLKQVSRFGEHRGFFAKKFPENSAKLTYFFPSLLVSSLIIGIVLSLFFSFFAYVLIFAVALYLASSLIAAALQVRSVKLLFSVWIGIIVTHIIYGSYFLSGLIKRDLKR
ncbi:MAG: glycosyltransferase [Candidatus Bathyarchaeia archaeon]|jgi:cellulose synthase/poly-beta-1,6-N-acetylglucosamine synthase-like glycosyltransferase